VFKFGTTQQEFSSQFVWS